MIHKEGIAMKQGISVNRLVLLGFIRKSPGLSLAQLVLAVKEMPKELKRHVLTKIINNAIYQAIIYLAKEGYVRIEPPKQLFLTKQGEDLLSDLDRILNWKINL
jgi:hypothetical protein